MLGTRTATALTAPVILFAVAALTPGDAAAVHPGSPCVDADASVHGTPVPRLRRATVCLVNEARAANGLRAVTPESRLDVVAQRHTDDMVATGTFDHRSPDGATPQEQARRAGYRGAGVGQNIAVGFTTARAVVASWLRSPGHCRNLLLPDFDDIGTGVSADGTAGVPGGTWTVVLGVSGAAGEGPATPTPTCPQDASRSVPSPPAAPPAPPAGATPAPPPAAPPAAPAPAPSAPAAALPTPGLRHVAAPRHRRGTRTVVLRLRCTRLSGACVERVRVTVGRGRATSTLARRGVRVLAGRSATVRLRLGPATPARLARSRRGRLAVRVVVPGTPARTLTLRR